MIHLSLHVGVEQTFVTFSAAPERVPASAEFFGDFHRLGDLPGGVCEHLGVWAGRGPVHVTRMTEQVGGSPKKLHARVRLLVLKCLGDLVEIPVRFGQCLALRCDVAIVKTVKIEAKFLEEFKRDFHPLDGVGDAGCTVVPRQQAGGRTELIQAVVKTVPVGGAETKMVSHLFAFDDLIGVVVLERQRVFGLRAFVLDPAYAFESFGHLHISFRC